MTTKEEVLQNCTVEGLVIKLPNVQLDRKVYKQVADALGLIGGKWKGGKVFGFVFNSDPTELLETLANGGNRNLKMEFQFFGTPPELADYLVELADINSNHHSSILEPSAGQGAIVDAIFRKHTPKAIGDIRVLELMDINRNILEKHERCLVIGDNYLEYHGIENHFRRIIANPPFSKNQDITHIQKMYNDLAPGGRLVSVASKHWQFSTNKKEIEFKAWLQEKNAQIIELESGKFKESGTMVASCIIVIDK